MKRVPLLTLTLGLVTGLVACQDGGVVAPDDEVISPDQLEITAAKKTPWTKEVHFPEESGGFTMDPSAKWDVSRADDKVLSLGIYDEMFTSNLSNTAEAASSPGWTGGGELGDNCRYDPIDTPEEVIRALAQQLEGPMEFSLDPDPEWFHHTLQVDKTAVDAEETSEDNRVQFSYNSSLEVFKFWLKKKGKLYWEPGAVVIRVGGILRIGTFGDPTVTRVGDGDTFMFSDGTVSVIWYSGADRPRLECLLQDDVVFEVTE